jgi:hypothetical protein
VRRLQATQGGCLKCCFYLLLLSLIFVGVIAWQATRIVEILIQPSLVDRSATIEISAIRVTSSGLRVEVDSYTEPGISIEQLEAILPWSGLLAYKHALNVNVNCGKLSLDAATFITDDPNKTSKTLGQQLAQLSDSIEVVFQRLIASLNERPVNSFDITIDEVECKIQGNTYQFELETSLITGVDRTTVLSLQVVNPQITCNARMRMSGTADSVGVDFSAYAKEWDVFSKKYLSAVLSILSKQQIDFYLDPLSDERFVDISGYARWHAEKPNELRAALLGNIGPTEVFVPHGEWSTESIAFGLATNGNNLTRAYLQVPIRGMRSGNWSEPSGELSFQMHNDAANIELKVGENKFSIQSAHILELLEGYGELPFSVELDALSADMLRSLAADRVPLDLNFEGQLRIDGVHIVDNFEWQDMKASSQWTVETLDWPSKSFNLQGFAGSIDLDGLIDFSPILNSTYNIKQMKVAGIEITDLATSIASGGDGKLNVDGAKMNALGGEIYLKSFEVLLAKRTSGPIKLVLKNIDLTTLAKAVPQFDGELEGKSSGDLSIAMTPAGLNILGGGLGLDADQPAHLSYSMKRLLTQGLKPGTAAHTQYQMAERALEDLYLQRFQIDFFPNADATKPVRLTFFGESNQEGTIVPVDYTLNVNTNDSAGLIQLLQMMQRGDLKVN